MEFDGRGEAVLSEKEVVDRLAATMEEVLDCPEGCASKPSRLLCVPCWEAKLTLDVLEWVLDPRHDE